MLDIKDMFFLPKLWDLPPYTLSKHTKVSCSPQLLCIGKMVWETASIHSFLFFNASTYFHENKASLHNLRASKLNIEHYVEDDRLQKNSML